MNNLHQENICFRQTSYAQLGYLDLDTQDGDNKNDCSNSKKIHYTIIRIRKQ